MSTAATLTQLGALLRAEGGLLAAALYPSGPVVPADDQGLGVLAAAGPRSAGHAEPIALAVEAAREADLLHGGRSRIMDVSDRDLAILAGDRLYALGLARLAEIGAVAAVSELADVIALCARTRVDAAGPLAGSVWRAGAAAIGWGTSAAHGRAKNALIAGSVEAQRLLDDAAGAMAGAALLGA